MPSFVASSKLWLKEQCIISRSGLGTTNSMFCAMFCAFLAGMRSAFKKRRCSLDFGKFDGPPGSVRDTLYNVLLREKQNLISFLLCGIKFY